MAFTDDDLKRLKEICKKVDLEDEVAGDAAIWVLESTSALLARLEAAEQVIADILHPDHGFFNEKSWRTEHLEAWRKSKGK